MNDSASRRILVTNDWQVDFHDFGAIEQMLLCAQDFDATDIILNGDIIDFSALQRKFRKNHALVARTVEQVKKTRDLLTLVRRMFPRANVVFVDGNHEARLYNLTVDVAPELEFLVDVPGPAGLAKLLDFDGLGIDHVTPYTAQHRIGSLMVTHGRRVSMHSANSAKLEFNDEVSSGISGHTHRGGSFYKTTSERSHLWVENFCMCHVDQEHRPPSGKQGTMNWQQGFSVVFYEPGIEKWQIYPVVIERGMFFGPNGKLYRKEVK